MPIGDIFFLVLVALSVGWVAVAAIRSKRNTLRRFMLGIAWAAATCCCPKTNRGEPAQECRSCLES